MVLLLCKYHKNKHRFCDGLRKTPGSVTARQSVAIKSSMARSEKPICMSGLAIKEHMTAHFGKSRKTDPCRSMLSDESGKKLWSRRSVFGTKKNAESHYGSRKS